MKELTPIDKDFHERRVAQFIVRYAKALKLQARGTHVIVYTDESYAHNNHASLVGWVFPSSLGVNINRRDGRLIMLHAMTRDGLLVRVNAEGQADRDEMRDKNLNEVTTNAEYIYEIEVVKDKDKDDTVATKTDAKDDKDLYHGNIDSVLWLKWFENRLVSAFEDRYPAKKMVLVMDNASYHNSMDTDWVPPSKMNRLQMVEALEKYGIKEVEGIRPWKATLMTPGSEVVTFPESSWKDSHQGSQIHPYNKELKIKLTLWLKSHPEYLKSVTRKRMEEMEGIIIFTPPLEPEFQPIELLWGMIKKLLAGAYRTGRTVEEAREQLMDILYKKEHRRRQDWEGATPARGVTSSHCKGMIRISEKFMNRWIQSHDRLVGELDMLLYPITLSPEEGAKEQRDSTYRPPDNVWRPVSEDDWEDRVKKVVTLLINHGLLANEAEKEEGELEMELERLVLSSWRGEEGEEFEPEDGKDEDETKDDDDDGEEAERMFERRIELSGGPMLRGVTTTAPLTLHPSFSLITDALTLSQRPR